MIGSTRRAFGLLAAAAAILLTSTAGVCNADSGRLELRQNVVGGVAETTTPLVAGGAAAAAAATTEAAAGGLLATTAEVAPGAVAAATTSLVGAGVAETTAALGTTAVPGAVATTPTAAAGADAETTALTHTTGVTTPKTSTTPAATTSTTTQAAVPNPGGAVGGGNGSPVSSTSSGAPNVVTATVGSGGMLEYASCIDFESKCNDSCSFGIFMMNCESGGACVCYQSNPDETTSDEADGDADDAKTSGASGFLSSVRSSFRTASLLSVLPALAMLAATAAFI